MLLLKLLRQTEHYFPSQEATIFCSQITFWGWPASHTVITT